MIEDYKVIAIISLIILILFFIVSLILIFSSDIVGMDKADIMCPVNYCATSILTGEKICPEPNKQIMYDISTQVCNKPNACDNLTGPQYAQQSDGSATLSMCEANSICNCKLNPTCSRYTLSVFNQDDIIITSETDNIVVKDNSNCVESIDNLFKCPSQSDVLSVNELSYCMGFDNNCVNGYQGSVCTRGILAIVTNINEFNEEDLNLYPVACVSGQPCECGQLTIFDTRSNSVICKSIIT